MQIVRNEFDGPARMSTVEIQEQHFYERKEYETHWHFFEGKSLQQKFI